MEHQQHKITSKSYYITTICSKLLSIYNKEKKCDIVLFDLRNSVFCLYIFLQYGKICFKIAHLHIHSRASWNVKDKIKWHKANNLI